MKASELRIGSLVDQGPLYGVLPVSSYEIYNFASYQAGAHVAGYYKEWKPAPITEEWLLKFGFEKLAEQPHHSVWNLPDSIFESFEFNGKVLCIIDAEGLAMLMVQFIHQLQNAYFVFMKEELALKTAPTY